MRLQNVAAPLLLSATVLAAGGFGEKREIRIRLDGAGQFSAKTLRAAETYAGDILETAGLRVSWVRAGKGGPADLRFDVVGRPPAGMDTRALGYTAAGPYSAAVVAPLVKGVADRLQIEEAVVLGAVVAHEAGHLLGLDQHSAEGIMAGELTRAQYLMAAQGSLRFTATEGRRLHEGTAHFISKNQNPD